MRLLGYQISGKVVNIIKWLFTATVLGVLFWQLKTGEFNYSELKTALQKSNWQVAILAMLLLSLASRALEALKWQTLLKAWNKQSFAHSLKLVFISAAAGILLPKSLSELATRAKQLPDDQELKSVGVLAVANLAQFASLVWVCGGVLLLNNTLLPYNIQWLFIPFALFYLWIFFQYKLWLKLLSVLPIKILKNAFSADIQYSWYQLSLLLAYSMLRQAVFSAQFVTSLYLFMPEVKFSLLLEGVSAVYLLKSILFTVNTLAETGIREASAVYIFGKMGLPAWNVVGADWVLLFFTRLMPAVIGSVFLVLPEKKKP